MQKIYLGLLAASLWCVPLSANSSDAAIENMCVRLLDHGIFERTDAYSYENMESMVRKTICTESNYSYTSDTNAAIDLTGSIDGIISEFASIDSDAFASYTDNQKNTHYKKFCQKEGSDEKSLAIYKNSIYQASAVIANSFVKCVSLIESRNTDNQVLKATFDAGASPNEFSINVTFSPGDNYNNNALKFEGEGVFGPAGTPNQYFSCKIPAVPGNEGYTGNILLSCNRNDANADSIYGSPRELHLKFVNRNAIIVQIPPPLNYIQWVEQIRRTKERHDEIRKNFVTDVYFKEMIDSDASNRSGDKWLCDDNKKLLAGRCAGLPPGWSAEGGESLQNNTFSCPSRNNGDANFQLFAGLVCSTPHSEIDVHTGIFVGLGIDSHVVPSEAQTQPYLDAIRYIDEEIQKILSSRTYIGTGALDNSDIWIGKADIDISAGTSSSKTVMCPDQWPEIIRAQNGNGGACQMIGLNGKASHWKIEREYPITDNGIQGFKCAASTEVESAKHMSFNAILACRKR